MKANELQSELKQIGIDVPMGTLGRWAHEGLIEGPRRYTERGKRGHFAEWLEASLEETAACWVVRNDRVGGPPAKEYIQGIRNAAHVLSHKPWEYCVIEQPPYRYFEGSKAHADHFWTHLVTDYVTPDETNDFQYASFTPEIRVAKWMAAVEKARRRIFLPTDTVVVYDWIIDWEGRDTDKALHEDQELTYRFNDVLFKTAPRAAPPVPRKGPRPKIPPSVVYTEVPTRRDLWKVGEHRLFHDEIRIFFRVPEFDEDLLKLVKKQR
ncbi:MAG: hypothetical protein ACXVIU_13180 [Halobacteriota archaeon]